jgi:hypothetical protein
MNELERSVLARLIMQPELLNQTDLSLDLFESEKNRRIFKEIKKLSENGGLPDQILISEETGIPVAEIIGLSDGVHRIPVEAFSEHIRRLREKK